MKRTVLLAVFGMLVSSPALAQTSDPVCHTQEEIVGGFYGDANATGDRYLGDDAGKVMMVLGIEFFSVEAAPAAVWILLNEDTGQSDVVLFNDMGCATVHVGPMSKQTALEITKAAGVPPAFAEAAPADQPQPKGSGI